ncbi:MAG: Methyltransferase family protein [Methanoculleus marisnigri]|uniref:Methyltransferase family protein n=1 Tax=Methanoculleus marisnigri TaxID=2198 RepID=A0A101GP43_9EURY|nr:MAG: Methyltransferase family protein [Methanoculleus marisnigri]
MLFLSAQESAEWSGLADEVLRSGTAPGTYDGDIRPNLLSAFDYYIGTVLAAHGQAAEGIEWLNAAALGEESDLFSAGFLLGFLERHNGKLAMPTVAFADPRPFMHFAGVPMMREARKRFIAQCGNTLPQIDGPFAMMDIGCGDGGLTVSLLRHLQDTGRVTEIAEVLLIDSSPAMVALAEKTVRDAFPDIRIETVNSRIQDCSGSIDHRFDLAVSSLAYHHMPIDVIDFVFSHDAPVDVAVACVDLFLMTEVISFFTQPRGERTDYHMLQGQWDALFAECLGPEFTPCCHSPCYADEHTTLFTMHYGREDIGC